MEAPPVAGLGPESFVRRAQAPFKFHTSFILQEATGLRAATLPQLVERLREVPVGCIYHHTHYFLLAHHYLTPEPTNDFAYWIGEVLAEERLGEQLATIDILQYGSLDDLRRVMIAAIERYLEQYPLARFKFASDGEEFFFVKSIHLILPTRHQAWTLQEFAQAIQHVSAHALYYHIFDARLRLGRPTNDFAVWLEQLGASDLAKEIGALDPYAHTMEALRSTLVSLIQPYLMEHDRHSATA